MSVLWLYVQHLPCLYPFIASIFSFTDNLCCFSPSGVSYATDSVVNMIGSVSHVKIQNERSDSLWLREMIVPLSV